MRLLVLAMFLCSSKYSVAAEPTRQIKLTAGELTALFQDNSRSPKSLSGIQSLFHSAAPEFDAYDPDAVGASAGLNFEHIISGHSDPDNKFTPRHGPYSLFVIDDQTVELRRRAEDSPWGIDSTMRYQLVPPHYIDFEFRCTPREIEKFGERGYAIFFWANYMHEVEDVALHFRGIASDNAPESWISGDAPQTHPDYYGGGTYRHRDARPLAYDDDHNFKLNVWSYDEPCYTEPFYYGRARNNMMFQLMFDRSWSEEDEIRFSLFKFKVNDERKRPAWDYQYVIHQPEANREYGYRGRLVWKPFVNEQDVISEYQRWRDNLTPWKTTTTPVSE